MAKRVVPMSAIGYVAGFFDGEGTIQITMGAHVQLKVAMSQKVREPLDFINEMFPKGRIYQRRDGLYDLVFSGRAAGNFLGNILPFLIVKKSQAEIAIAVAKRFRGSGDTYTMSDLDFFEQAKIEITELKRPWLKVVGE